MEPRVKRAKRAQPVEDNRLYFRPERAEDSPHPRPKLSINPAHDDQRRATPDTPITFQKNDRAKAAWKRDLGPTLSHHKRKRSHRLLRRATNQKSHARRRRPKPSITIGTIPAGAGTVVVNSIRDPSRIRPLNVSLNVSAPKRREINSPLKSVVSMK